MKKTKEMFKGAIVVICAIMVLDFGGALMWASSGQRPTDEFYLGTITTHIVRSIAQ